MNALPFRQLGGGVLFGGGGAMNDICTQHNIGFPVRPAIRKKNSDVRNGSEFRNGCEISE